MSTSRPTYSSLLFIQLIQLIQNKFKTEKDYYARDDVPHNANKVGEIHPANWTTEFLSAHVLTTAPNPEKGDRFQEFERTITSLYCYLLLLEGGTEAYEYFIAAQKMTPTIKIKDYLTRKNFNDIHERLKDVIGNDKDKAEVLMYLIIYSDLGKSPAIKKSLEKNHPTFNLLQNADGLMTDILKLKDEEICVILPSFADLSVEARAILKEAYPLMNACQGHIYFLERGKRTFDIVAKALENIPRKRRENALNLVDAAQLVDALGAQGQKNIFGSITCTNPFAQGYALLHEKLELVETAMYVTDDIDTSVNIAFNEYLNTRAAWLGMEGDPALSTTQKLLTRLSCCIRGATPKFGNQLREQFARVEPYHASLLETQLGFSDAGLEGWPTVDYIATGLQKVSLSQFEKANIAENKGDMTKANHRTSRAIHRAINAAICFSMLLEHIAANYPQFVKDSKRSISFASFAFDTDPKELKPAVFNPKHYLFDPAQGKVKKDPKLVAAQAPLIPTLRI